MTEPTQNDQRAGSLNADGETRPDRVWTVDFDDFTRTVNLTVRGPGQKIIRQNFFDAGQARKLGKALIAAANFIKWPDDWKEEP